MEKNNKVKYKFGLNEIDLNLYIQNLDSNAQSYLNSKNWSDDLKLEFISSYNNLLSKFKDLLENNTNRFSTDTFGTITDTLREISNDDNLPETLYYYNLNGEKISLNDYNNLKDRQKKNYSAFLANKEVASYFNIIGNAIRQKLDQSNSPADKEKFDINNLGFVSTWSKINNPAGGDFDLTPYVNLDKANEDGTIGTQKRSEYLKLELLNYLNNNDYSNLDFSDTPYKTWENYKNSILEAINSLNNGYNSLSIIALNKAGLSSNFLNPFFKTKNDEEINENGESDSAEELYKKLGYTDELISTIMQALLLQEQLLRESTIRLAQQSIDDYNRLTWINSLLNKPFLSRVNFNLNTYKPAYNEKWVVDNFNRSYNKDALNWLNHELLLNYFRDPNKQRVFRGKLNNAYQHLSNNLDWAVKSGILNKFKLNNNLYAIPNTIDYNNMSVISYDPNNSLVQEVSLLNYLDAPKVLEWLNTYYNNISKHKEGGILKYLSGGDFDDFYNYINNFELNLKLKLELAKQVEKLQRELNNGYNPKDNVTPHTELSRADMLRLTAIAGDLGSLIANFTGVGSVASAGIGATSTALNLAADMAEGLGFWQSLGNNLTSYGLDAISVLPFAKAAKIPKMIKTLARFTPYITGAISTALGIANAPEMLNSWSKIKNGLDLTVADWRNIANSILIVLGGTAATGRAVRSNKKVNAALSDTHSWLKTNNGYRKVANEDIEKIRNMNSLEELNKFLKEKYGVTISKQSKLFKKDSNTGNIKTLEYYDFSKPVTLYSGDLPYTRKFGWGERAIGNLLTPSLPNIGVRNIYNKYIHPLAYKRKYGKKSNKKYKSDFISKKYNLFRDWLDGEVEIEKDGGTLDIAKVRKFLNAGKISLNNGIADWNSLDDPKKDILWPGSAEYSKSPLSKYVVPRLGTSSGVSNVSKGQNYSFDTASRLKSVIDRVKNNKMTTDDVSEMLKRHWGMHYTWEPLMLPIYKDLVALYLTDYLNLGFNDEIIKPNYSANYIINSKHPTSGDITPNWTSDGLYSLITDDRRILARKADYDNNPELLQKDIEYAKLSGYEYYLDPETDYYMLRPLSSNQLVSASKLSPSNNEETLEKTNNLKLINLLLNPTITYGLPRALYADWINKKMTNLAIKSVSPVLSDPFTFHRYTRSNLDSEMLGEKNYASLTSLANKPITSNGESLDAMRLEAELKGLEARNEGRQVSNQVLRQYDELAWLQEKENAKNIHDNAIINRLLLLDVILKKNNFNLAYLSKKYNIWDTLGLQLELEAKQKIQENKALNDKFAMSDIHNAIMANPNKYGANLSLEELNAWNLVLSGALPSSLKNKLKYYILANKKVQLAENNLIRNYYNIPNTEWTNYELSNNFSPVIAKNGIKISELRKYLKDKKN